MEKERSMSTGADTSPRRHARESLNRDVETGLSACDACYQRKIKCDRKSPCCNCQDSNSTCLRLRQRQARKPRENVSSKLNETRQEMDARIASLENTITGLMGTKKHNTNSFPRSCTPEPLAPASISQTNLPPEIDGRKRTNSGTTKETKNSCGISSLSIWNSYSMEPSNSTPPFSAVEAQSMIEKVLSQGSRLSKQKREAFHSALGSLSESLNTSHLETNSLSSNAESLLRAQELIDSPAIPDVEAIQWMLQPGQGDDILWSMPDGLPFISSESVVQMSIEMQDSTKRKNNPAIVVCVDTLVGHFLLDQLMSAKVKTGLEAGVKKQIAAYFATAQAFLSQINLFATPSIPNIQALIFGSINAQEAGHSMDAWRLNTAASNMGIVLNLHKRLNSFSSASPKVQAEANYCFFICYINDKGLAMNLGKPPTIPDAYLEVSLHELVPPLEPLVRQHLQDQMLHLALIQSAIIDLQATKSKMTPEALDLEVDRILNMFDIVSDLIAKICTDVQPDSLKNKNMQFEIVLGKFSFYTIKAILFHSCIRTVNQGKYMGPLLEAARASMEEMKNLRDSQDNFNEYKIHSFAHWSVLYYPFTSFFVLFCNVISKQFLPDYERILDFVAYLKKAKANSAPVTKLYNLCLPFCALASTAIKSTAEPQANNDMDTRPSKRPRSSGTGNEGQPPHAQQDTDMFQSHDASLQNGQAATGIPQNFDGQLEDGVQGNDLGMIQDDDNFFAQFMDFQPRLQWLDTDFSAFEETWEQTGFGGYGQDGMGYPEL